MLMVLLALLFGLVMSGLIPIGNGYIINSQCTENGRFVAAYGADCGGFSVLGLEHILWHPRVTITTGVVLLLMEALVWAALLLGLIAIVRYACYGSAIRLRSARTRAWLLGAGIAGLLIMIHFVAVPVASKLTTAPADCLSSVSVCPPCPGVVSNTTSTRPQFQDYGWPFHIVRNIYAADPCGQSPSRLDGDIDILAVLFNWAFWSLMVWAVVDWLGFVQAERRNGKLRSH